MAPYEERMRMLLPPKALRKQIIALLRDFYRERDPNDFETAWTMLYGFFQIDAPTVRWRRKIDDGTTLGQVHNGERRSPVELIRPSDWAKRRPPFNTEDEWLTAVFHEGYHFVWYHLDEQKADAFAERMMTL
jgi:hypothetical protein